MPEQVKPKRKPSRSYRPPKHLEAELDRRVSQSGLSFNAFMTEAWYGRSRHRPAELKLLGQILATCARIADAVREVQLSGPGNCVLLLEQIRDELILIRNAIMSWLGRKS